MTKLTTKIVGELRTLYRTGEYTHAELHEMYELDCAVNTVRSAIGGDSWGKCAVPPAKHHKRQYRALHGIIKQLRDDYYSNNRVTIRELMARYNITTDETVVRRAICGIYYKDIE